MNELAKYLLENIILDFEGEITTDIVRAFLRKDDSAEARALIQKIVEDGGVDDLLLAVADCLSQEMLTKFKTAEVAEHLNTYSEA